MCGLAGTVDLRAESDGDTLTRVAVAMAGAVRHRGPDDQGSWVDVASGVALAHQRLSIVDLSPGGHQPMVSQDGRWVLVYNGEVYDHPGVRRRLANEGVAFRSSSDTEVLLEGIAKWGVRATLEACNGMWGLAAYDRSSRRLVLAVDRFGEKPLYVGWDERWLFFGSELKALVAHPSTRLSVDRDALTAYLRYGCIPAPYSIYQSVHKLPAGTLLEIPIDGSAPRWAPQAWWSIRDVARTGASAPPTELGFLLAELDDALTDSVALRMVADVPVGAFLSGGIDSSLVAAIMTEQSSNVRTFSIGFDDKAYDESAHAAAVAAHLGTHHTELRVTSADSLQLIPTLPEMYDEPFADSSQIPTALLAALTRSHVTVALSGDGGDELFAGYDRYGLQRRLTPALRAVPLSLRRAAAGAITALPPTAWDGAGRAAGRLFPRLRRETRFGDRAHKAARVLSSTDAAAAYLRLMSAWDDPAAVVVGGHELRTFLSDSTMWQTGGDVIDALRLVDQCVYLPGDILTKVDRAAMAASLETRVPLLDPRVVTLAWRAPAAVHRHDGRGKYLLRALLDRRVPPSLTSRPKMGFGVPVGAWLRAELRPWAEELLDERRLRDEGYLDSALVRATWAEHLSGTRDWTPRLWAVLMWQAWLERWQP